MTYHFTDYEELEELRKLNANQRQSIINLRLENDILRKQVNDLTNNNNFLRAQIEIKKRKKTTTK